MARAKRGVERGRTTRGSPHDRISTVSVRIQCRRYPMTCGQRALEMLFLGSQLEPKFLVRSVSTLGGDTRLAPIATHARPEFFRPTCGTPFFLHLQIGPYLADL
jgi:hypothetical protein